MKREDKRKGGRRRGREGGREGGRGRQKLYVKAFCWYSVVSLDLGQVTLFYLLLFTDQYFPRIFFRPTHFDAPQRKLKSGGGERDVESDKYGAIEGASQKGRGGARESVRDEC